MRGHEIWAKRALEMTQAAALPGPVPTTSATMLSHKQTPKRSRKSIEASDVQTLSARDCVIWLKHIGISYQGNLALRKQRLQEYFANKPTGYRLELS